MNETTDEHSAARNQTKVLRVFFACFAPSRWKSSPGFAAKLRRAPRARRKIPSSQQRISGL